MKLPMDAEPSFATLVARLVLLEQQVARLEDVNAIRKLHRLYGYYIDKRLYRETVELLSSRRASRLARFGATATP